MKILYIQYAGDFSEAYHRLIENDGKEYYYGQKYSVNAVVNQARNEHQIMIITMNTNGYREELENNLTALGLTGLTNKNYKTLQKEIGLLSPDFVILTTPDFKILKHLRKRKHETLPVFADSFEKIPFFRIRSHIKKYLLARELNYKSIKWVANHQINASISIKNLGINPNKILPYDWEHEDNPLNWKKIINDDISKKELSIFYAGSISEKKGIFDLIRSGKYIKESGRRFKIKIAGGGDHNKLLSLAKEYALSDNIEIIGLITHDAVLTNMNESDVVVVPSHHTYPEGLPMTIMEALMVHTPVVASDHPMFLGRVGLKGSVIFFKEQDAHDLCEKILTVCGSLERYKNMSINAQSEWDDLNLDLKWENMINNWVNNPNFDFSNFCLEKCLKTQSEFNL